MNDVYEVDNRYPEVAEPYEKIRGVKRHGGLQGARELAAAKRITRRGSLKRSFWTAAAAVGTALIVLLSSPGGDFHAAEPEPVVVVTVPAETETEAPPETLTDLPPETVSEAPETTPTETVPAETAPTETEPAETEPTETEPTETEPTETEPTETEPTETEPTETEPFNAPTLIITEAAVNGTEVTPLSYRYAVTLNSAEKMEVTAAVTADNGTSLGTDGPYTHKATENAPARRVNLSWSARPKTVTLTLTGTYVEKGEKKTVTVRRTLEVPELPFVAPTIRVTSAYCDDMDPTTVVYSAVIQANSADPLTLNVSASANGEVKGTDGPIRMTGNQTWTGRTLRISEEEDDMVLTLTGTYVEKGVTKTIRASANIKESEVFEWPEIEVDHVERGPGDLVRYGYYVVVNSGSGLKVRTQFLDAGGSVVYETGPTDVGSGGSFGVYSVHTGRRASSIRLVGEFAHLGKTYTVNGSDEIPDEVTFVEPDVEILSASTNNFLGGDPAKLSFSFRVTMGDAERLPLRLTVITDSGEDISPVWSQTFTANGSFDVTVPINVPEGETGMYIMLSGFYTIEGEEHQALAMKTVTVPMANLRPLAHNILTAPMRAMLFRR